MTGGDPLFACGGEMARLMAAKDLDLHTARAE
jgi:hypothetical protein